MLSTAGSRLVTTRINGHMHFRNVFRSIAPVDPPTVEQTAACHGYAFKKWRFHRRCLISPSGGMMLYSTVKIHNFATTNGPVPKKSRKWRSSVPADPIGQPALFWMSFPSRRKSLAISLDILFHFVLPSSMCRVGGWRSKSEWREEGVGDQVDFVVRQRERESTKGRGAQCVWYGYTTYYFRWNKKLIRLTVSRGY